jgi:glyoxylase-like metal-dependent hydrolase (beta-lactamase superfamily II)
MDVTDTVHSYDIPWSYGGYDEPLTVQVLETEEATVLFGSGTAETAPDLLDAIEDHDIDVVIVEHGDIDHYGGVPALRDAFDVEVAVPAGDADFLAEADIEADQLLEAGETYWGIETISVPGHTPDNMAYRYGEVLVAGDTVCGSDSPFCAEGDWPGKLAPLTAELNNDDSLTLRSIPTLLDYEFDVVLLTHGQNVLEDGYAEVETLVEALE